MKYQEFFKNKKITLMGLGVLGRGVGDARFLAKYAKHLTVTDLKTERELTGSLKKLKNFKNIKFVLGKHKLEDFRNTDIVIKSAGVPLNSPFIKEAQKNKVPVFMSTALFAKFFVDQFEGKIIGITGTRGKTTVTNIIFHILKENGYIAEIGGNIQGVSTLAMLEKIRPKSVIVLELDSWQLQGFGDMKISPNVSVFTTFFPDHMNYYKNSMGKYLADKANIFRWQKQNDYLIAGKQTVPAINKSGYKIKSKIKIANEKKFKDIKTNLIGEHNISNITCAIEALLAFGLTYTKIKNSLKTFKEVPGRLEYVKSVKDIKVYNDTTSTTPEAGIAALKALGKNKNIILICGGSDKNLDMTNFIKEAKQKTKKIFLLNGSGSEKIKEKFGIQKTYANLKEAVLEAINFGKNGDILLFSPAFASFGMFKNEYDRGEKFLKIMKKLK